jgi:hypothetical protein
MLLHTHAINVLREAAVFAGQAPSIHNSQPWQWRIDGDVLDLLLEPGRLLDRTDPESRLATLSCGAALHHARIELAATGWRFSVHRFPDRMDATHLASLHLDGPTPIEPAAARLVQAARRRYTDRRTTPGAPLDFDKLRSIRTVVRREGTDLKLLRPDQVFTLAKANDRARDVEADDPGRQMELGDWIGDARTPGTGVPRTTLPEAPLSDIALGLAFRRAGSSLTEESHHHASVFGVLHGAGDEPINWLRAGEAMSAGWLTATDLAVSVLPLSVVVEVDGSRDMIQRLLGGYELPYLVLRFAAADPLDGRSVPTPRLPSEATIRVITHLRRSESQTKSAAGTATGFDDHESAPSSISASGRRGVAAAGGP